MIRSITAAIDRRCCTPIELATVEMDIIRQFNNKCKREINLLFEILRDRLSLYIDDDSMTVLIICGHDGDEYCYRIISY
jgi:hypothetical protein